MPRIETIQVNDPNGNVTHAEQVIAPLTIAGQHRETHQVVIGGAALRLGPSSATPVVTNLPPASPVAVTGRGESGWLPVATDLGSGWLPEISIIAV